MNGYQHNTSLSSDPQTKINDDIDQEALLQARQSMVRHERMSKIERAIKDVSIQE